MLGQQQGHPLPLLSHQNPTWDGLPQSPLLVFGILGSSGEGGHCPLSVSFQSAWQRGVSGDGEFPAAAPVLWPVSLGWKQPAVGVAGHWCLQPLFCRLENEGNNTPL